MVDNAFDAFIMSLGISSQHGVEDMDAVKKIYLLGVRFDGVVVGDRTELEAIRSDLLEIDTPQGGHSEALKGRFLEVLNKDFGAS